MEGRSCSAYYFLASINNGSMAATNDTWADISCIMLPFWPWGLAGFIGLWNTL